MKKKTIEKRRKKAEKHFKEKGISKYEQKQKERLNDSKTIK